jgi:hypothetical protein
MRIPLPLLLLAALVASLLPTPTRAFATEGEHEHDPTALCKWQADAQPAFPPGQAPVIDYGIVRRHSILGEHVGTRQWSIVVLPAYHVGFVMAMDRGIPLSSQVVKAYARRSVYGVNKSNDCCAPARRAKALMACGFRVRAAVPNPPGSASAQGLTYILAANTQVSLTTAAAVTTDSAQSGAEIVLAVPGPNGTTVKVKFNLGFDSADESIDEISTVTTGPSRPAPDEEYHICTDLHLKATADGHPFNSGLAEASLTKHTVTLETKVRCDHCAASVDDLILIDGPSYGTE